jgi:hypothetical protein
MFGFSLEAKQFLVFWRIGLNPGERSVMSRSRASGIAKL